MSVVVLDETRKRCVQMSESLEKGKKSVTYCTNSNDFLTKITAAAPERLFIDVESWNKGRVIYSYFDIGKKLADVPVVFYNAPENFAAVEGRPRHGQDEILPAPTAVESVVELARKLI